MGRLDEKDSNVPNFLALPAGTLRMMLIHRRNETANHQMSPSFRLRRLRIRPRRYHAHHSTLTR
jgi:hypothetical protein